MPDVGHYLAEGIWNHNSGKSFIGGHKLVAAHLWNAFNAAGEPTFVPSAVVGPTFRAMEDFQIPNIKLALQAMGLSYVWRDQAKELIIPDLGTKNDPSKFICRTAEKPETITGWEVGAAWGDEAARWKEDRDNPLYDPFIQLTGRIRHPRSNYRIGMFTYTNEGDHTRIYEQAHSGKAGHAAYRLLTRNNVIPQIQEFYNTQRGLLTKEMAEQYLDGGALNLRGSHVYGNFNPSVNGRPAAAASWGVWGLRKSLPLCLMLDFNIAPGMHGLIGQRDEKRDVAAVFHEFFRPRMDLPALLVEFEHWIGRAGGFQWPMLEVYGDATGGSADAHTGKSCYSLVRQYLDSMKIPYKMKVPGQNPLVVDRVMAVNAAFKDMFGRVHLFVDTLACPRLAEDFKQVRYDNKGVLDKSNQNLTHPSDALGYFIHYVRPVRVKSSTAGGRFSVSTADPYSVTD